MSRSKKIKKLIYIKELVFLAVALCSVIFLFIDLLEVLTPAQTEALAVFDVTVGILFIAEFFAELYVTSDNRYYIKHNWYYLIAAIPLPGATFQLLRVLRVIRVVKVFRFGVSAVYGRKKASRFGIRGFSKFRQGV